MDRDIFVKDLTKFLRQNTKDLSFQVIPDKIMNYLVIRWHKNDKNIERIKDNITNIIYDEETGVWYASCELIAEAIANILEDCKWIEFN